MSNETGTSTVAAIEDRNHNHCGDESDSSGEITYTSSRKKKSKKRFLQLYTSKAYRNQRSKLVQPHISDDDYDNFDDSSQQMITNRNSNLNIEDEEHVLSPRIVEAVTRTTQVVWANCQKSEGLLGRSDMKLQTAIGMPVGVDESGNVWVVVMFSPNNVESTSDAIDYLQYISRSAASTSIPCLLPVAGGSAQRRESNNIIINGEENQHSLVSFKPKMKIPDTTRDLGEGVTAKFMSFNLNDDKEDEINESVQVIKSISALKDASKIDLGVPAPAALIGRDTPLQYLDAIDDAITDAFDEASYGVWSTIMNSAGGAIIQTSETIAAKMHLIQERLEEFANAFLGMSVFDIADAWTVSSYSADGFAQSPVMKSLFTVAATESNPEINAFREISAKASIAPGDGAIGKAFSTGFPVWSSAKVSCTLSCVFFSCDVECHALINIINGLFSCTLISRISFMTQAERKHFKIATSKLPLPSLSSPREMWLLLACCAATLYCMLNQFHLC